MTIVYGITEYHLVSQESSFGTEKGESEPSIPDDTELFGSYTTIQRGHGSQRPLRFTCELYASPYSSGAVFDSAVVSYSRIDARCGTALMRAKRLVLLWLSHVCVVAENPLNIMHYRASQSPSDA